MNPMLKLAKNVYTFAKFEEYILNRYKDIPFLQKSLAVLLSAIHIIIMLNFSHSESGPRIE